MGAALITATQITFKYDDTPPQPVSEEKPQQMLSEEDRMQAQLAEQLNLPSLADTSAASIPLATKEPKVTSFCYLNLI